MGTHPGLPIPRGSVTISAFSKRRETGTDPGNNRGERSVRVQDIMVRQYEAVRPDTTLQEAAAKLCAAQTPIGRLIPLLVMDGDRLAGIVTLTDLLRAVLPPYVTQDPHLAPLAWEGLLETQFKHVQGKKVGEIMTSEVFTVPETAPLTEAAELFFSHHVRSLPVMQGKRVVGVLYLSDLARKVFIQLADQNP